LVPYSNDTTTLVAVPNEVRLPFNVAEVAVIFVAAFVLTDGGVIGVVVGINEVGAEGAGGGVVGATI
jgi:hypothetical protein